MESIHTAQPHAAWNKDKLVGQKTPFKLKEIWAIRIRCRCKNGRELALFDLGIDSKLRACNRVAHAPAHKNVSQISVALNRKMEYSSKIDYNSRLTDFSPC